MTTRTPWITRSLAGERDLALMRTLLQRLGDRAAVVDFEEQLLQPSVRERVRLWLDGETCTAFAWVDDYDNLWFELDPELRTLELEDQVVAWGVELRRDGENATDTRSLDASCEARDMVRLALLARHGFQQTSERSLRYARTLDKPLPNAPLPRGFALRPVHGEAELEALVALHRAAFGTQRMNVESRLALMRAPGYVPEMDTVAEVPSGELAGFCVGGFADEAHRVGYTDPVGVHPHYQRRGLARAMMVAVLGELRRRGAEAAEVGTSSENLPMCRLAESLGYRVVSERVWLSKQLF